MLDAAFAKAAFNALFFFILHLFLHGKYNLNLVPFSPKQKARACKGNGLMINIIPAFSDFYIAAASNLIKSPLLFTLRRLYQNIVIISTRACKILVL